MKLFQLTATAILTAAITLLSSCLSGEDDQHSASGYFTVSGDMTSGYTLYLDGGGKLTPTMASVSKLTNNKGFESIERAFLTYTYKEKDLSADRSEITGAELIAGESLDVNTPVSTQSTEATAITAADSTFDIGAVTHIWAYRGFLTVIYEGQYAWNEKKNGYLYPRINMVYNAEERIPNELNVTIYHNEHRDKKDAPAGKMQFTSSFRLAPLQYATQGGGSDSIRVNISAAGWRQPYTIKVARQDFTKGNYR